MTKRDNPVTDWPVDSAANYLSVKINEFARRPDLTEAERAVAEATWQCFHGVSASTLRRCNPDLDTTTAPEETPKC